MYCGLKRVLSFKSFLFPFLKNILFIYSWKTDKGRDAGRGRSRPHAGSPTRDSIPAPRITLWAEGAKPLGHWGCPQVGLLNTWFVILRAGNQASATAAGFTGSSFQCDWIPLWKERKPNRLGTKAVCLSSHLHLADSQRQAEECKDLQGRKGGGFRCALKCPKVIG